MTEYAKKLADALKHCAAVDCDNCPYVNVEDCSTKLIDAAHEFIAGDKAVKKIDDLQIAPPWIQYVNKLKALFGKDNDIRIEYSNDTPSVSLYVEGQAKASALSSLLPQTVLFGGVSLSVNVIPANDNEPSYADLFRAAFKNNPVVTNVISIDNVFTDPLTYMVFKKEVVQFYNDDLSDPHGNCSTLYQDLADEIFKTHDGVFFCTDDCSV